MSPQVTGGNAYTGGEYISPYTIRDPFQSQLPMTIPQANISNPANEWYNKAVPPGGTGFNPNYMSTPPPGFVEANRLIPWAKGAKGTVPCFLTTYLAISYNH